MTQTESTVENEKKTNWSQKKSDLPGVLRVRRLDPKAALPTRAHPDDAGLDLYALEDVEIESNGGELLRTGVAMAIPKGYVGMIADRSSFGKKGLKTAGGIIDAGYRGEVKVIARNLTQEPFSIRRGERIAQLLLIPIATPQIEEVLDLGETSRGAGGFGSTGV